MATDTSFGGAMNNRLKGKIVEQFGSQSNFSQALCESEWRISRVINGRLELDSDRQNRWADALGCNSKELFENTQRVN